MAAEETHHPLHEWFADPCHVPIGMQLDENLPSSFSWEALSEGLYIAGTDSGRRTELLTQQLLSIAKQGHGFCYIHPDWEPALDLLAKLPPERLDDVIWIDLKRTELIEAREYDIPRDKRITVTPLTVDNEIETGRLNTPPASARIADVLDVYQQEAQVTWPVLSLLEELLQASIERGYTLREMTRRAGEVFTAVRETGGGRSLATDAFGASGAEAVETALERDPTTLDRTAALLHTMTVSPHNEVFHKGTSISFRETIESDAIVLVSGDRIHPEPEWGTISHSSTRATQLLATTIVRRLWEALQDSGTAGQRLYPIAIDEVESVLPRDSTVLRELLTERGPRGRATCGGPWLAGPLPGKFPTQLRTTMQEEIPAWALLADDGSQELARTARWLDRSAGAETSETIKTAVRNERIGLMAFTEHGVSPFEMFPPYPQRHGSETIQSAITRSCEAHGRTSRLPHPGDVKIARSSP